MTEIHHYQDYRQYLKAVLEERARSSGSYSLRSFAADLGMHASRLSEVLSKKKNLSVRAAATISNRLALGHQETEYFCDLVQYAQAKTPDHKRVLAARIHGRREPDSYQVLREDLYRSISDWYHYAILELTFTEDFRSDPHWIASRLKISPIQSKLAIERLLRLKLLKFEGGQLKKNDPHLSTTMDVPSTAIRSTTKELLQKSMAALDTQKIEDRDFSTMTMAIDKTKIPEAKTMIQDFRRKLCAFLESGEQKEVYCLSVQLFQLSNDKP